MKTREDVAAVEEAVLDYFEGWFGGDVARMRRALHPGLAKRALQGDGAELNETSAEWMIDATAEGRGKREGVEIDVDVIDVYGDIANAVVRSSVYREYVQLVRTGEGWKIVNALWQKT